MREAVLKEANAQGGNAELADSRRLRVLDCFICINEAILQVVRLYSIQATDVNLLNAIQRYL